MTGRCRQCRQFQKGAHDNGRPCLARRMDDWGHCVLEAQEQHREQFPLAYPGDPVQEELPL